MPAVTFPDGTTVDAEAGVSVLQVAARAGFPMEAPCGGRGTCGRCRVRVSGELLDPTPVERALLSPAEIAEGVRLACRARFSGDVRVTEVLGRPQVEDPQLVAHSLGPRPRATAPRASGLAVVVDVGTTTLAVGLVDRASARELGHAGALNPQVRYGDDVMSRLAARGEEGALHDVLVRHVGSLSEEILARHGADPADVSDVVAVGNTVMMHMFLGEPTSGLTSSPYEPAFTGARSEPADRIGLELFGRTRVRVPPAVSVFVGPDVTAGLLAVGLEDHDGAVLYVDVGTNGEIVLKLPSGRMIAASTAAGPALEGATIEKGMRATAGAVERVDIEGGVLRLHTIAGAPPTGICGSGVIDLVAALLERGVLDVGGRIVDTGDRLAHRIAETPEGRRVWLDEGRGIYLTQKDVREVQLAKGAIRAGIDVLLDEGGVSASDVAEVIVAGGFGLHLRPSALVRMGMFPPEWRERIEFVGNAAKAGAEIIAVEPSGMEDVERVAGRVKALDLAAHERFRQRFIEAMSFPG